MQLTIYLEKGCPGCERATQIADEIAQRHDRLDVQVLDLAEIPDLPEAVIAVPAYVLDGRLVSLGNPYVADLSALIERELDEATRLLGAEKV